ncbi:trypsin-like peptidase domain-containing protein [Caulobacter sp. S45]|uniref:trypsin-like peptidase domain-containing protein n=1 Tax=Caulobacter sp. S45 TaxID=1641861 RepID=UPI00131CBD64|nr:trypsin-like peptidase domain-containing protein [Caulobacter sp. S45]
MSIKNKGFLAGATIGIGLTAAAAVGAGVHIQRASAEAQAIQPMAPPGAMAPTGAPMSFANIIQRVAPAVVSIEVTTHLEQPRTMQIPGLPFQFNVPPQGGGDDQGDDNDDSAGQGADPGDQVAPPTTRGGHKPAPKRAPRGPEAMAAGSGFFISADGYVVTNNHVVEKADTIKVTLSDQRELTAKLVGRDPLSDLAVIKVEGNDFPFVSFETASKPRVGDWVIAIGNPYTLGGTVTAGIVSAEERNIGQQFVNYLQIDAPINRGNSGGPTFDVYGRVVGVNTAIFSESGGSVGIGFAIPADLANSITKQLIATHHIVRGYLGVSIQTVTPEVAAAEGITPHQGALVGDVTAGGPGAKAGVQVGDIILSINGHPVKSSEDLSQTTAQVPAGGELKLEILRAGHHLSILAHSGVRPSEATLNGGAKDDDEDGSGATPGVPASTTVLGMKLTPVDATARQKYNIGPTVHGVVVTAIATTSDAMHVGLRPGYVIQRAGDHTVNSPADVAAAVADAKREKRPSVLLLVNMGGRTGFVPVKLDSDGGTGQE